MGSHVIRKVKGNEYLYYAYYDENKKRIDMYCGAVSDPKSKIKVRKCEIADLQSQKERISRRIAELKA